MVSQRVDTLDSVLAAIEASWCQHALHEPASEAAIDVVDRALGIRLPDEVRRLYHRWDGIGMVGGNLTFYPLEDDEGFCVRGASGAMRANQWPVPRELLVLGDNGQGDAFGLWLPALTETTAPVVELGQIFEPGCMALAGTSVANFIRTRLAYYLRFEDPIPGWVPTSALEALGLPPHLHDDFDSFEGFVRWADPAHPEPGSGMYEDRLDPDGIADVVARIAQDRDN